MRLSKKQRETIRLKYDGKCAYCGCDLPDRWAVDHILPLVRLGNGDYKFPERNNIENLTPSCISCNTIKGTLPLEKFRNVIKGFIQSLNRDSTQYKFAKRYNLIKEQETEVKFYFETL
jgi:5-methylcytosine-specific restriction endonuclease McrA